MERMKAKRDLSRLRDLCLKSTVASIKALCEVESWPRPARARVLRIGHDFYGDDLRDIKELDELTGFLASQQEIQSLYLRDQRDKHILFYYWIRFLVNVLTETEGNSLSKPVFDRWFTRFVNELYADTAIWQAIDTIDGLTLAGKEFRLDKFTVLTSVPGSKILAMVPRHDKCFDADEFIRSEWEGAYPTTGATLITTMKITKSKYKGGARPIWPSAKGTFNETGRASAALAAIRLTKPGSPRLGCHALFQISYLPIAEPLGFCYSKWNTPLFDKGTTLTRSDWHAVKSVWRDLMKVEYGQTQYLLERQVNRMDVATARFFTSYETRNWLENLLDLTIALEALFNPTDDRELSHRIALRCAWLLATDASTTATTSDNTYACVRAMYDLRSAIVHGDTPSQKEIGKYISTLTGIKYDRSKDWELKPLAVESARDIVRRSIRACALLSGSATGEPHWPLPGDFDRNIVSPGEQRKWQKAAGISK